MAESSVNVTEGSGKRLHTSDRTISSVLVQDQFVLPGEYPYASYIALASGIAIATSAAHVVQLMAGSTNYVRIRRIRIEQASSATAASTPSFQLYRLTTAGTGGTSVTPAKFDTGDAASGATAMTLPSSKGTEDTLLYQVTMAFRQALAASGSQMDDSWEWTQHPGQKPIIIDAGTSNGLAIKIVTGIAGATVNVQIEFVETSFL